MSQSHPDEPATSGQQPVPHQPHQAGAHLAREGRRHPSTIGGLWYLVVLASTLVGIVVVWARDWRVGVDWIGGALVAAAIARLLLPVRDAGMLAVRHRVVDVVLLAALGLTLIFLSITIPNQPG